MYLYYENINKKYFEKYYLNKIIYIERLLNLNNNNSVYDLPFKIIFNYFSKSNLISDKNINQLIKFYNGLSNKKTICYKKLISENNNFNYGILPNLLNLGYIVYNNKLAKNIPSLKLYIVDSNADFYLMYYFPKKETLVISFRGTVKLDEFYTGLIDTNRTNYKFKSKKMEVEFLKWRKNFINKNSNEMNLPDIKDKKIMVHNGYIKRYNYLKNHIINKIKCLIKKGLKNVILTGHSMGGCIATLCGMNLKELYENKLNIFISSFGSPGLGNRNLSLYFLYLNIESYIRIYNRDDIISKLRNNLWYRPFGRLRHVNYSIPNKYKDILESSCVKRKYKNRILINDCQDYLPNTIKNLLNNKNYKKEYKYKLLHSSFRFSNDKEAPLFT